MGVDTNSPACAQLFFFSQDFTFRGGGGWSAVTPKPMSRPSRSSGATLLALDRRRGLKSADRKVRLAVLSANRVGSPLPDAGVPARFKELRRMSVGVGASGRALPVSRVPR